MKVKFWGTRGSIATPGLETYRYGGNTPCVSVRHKGSFLILDAGTGIRKLGMFLQKSASGLPLEVHILLSHVHWDHIQGLPFFTPFFVPGNEIHIHGLPPSEKTLEQILALQMNSEFFPVAMRDLPARIMVHDIHEEKLRIGPFTITYAFLNHPGITAGYRIEAGGKIVTYATDTEPYRRLLADHHPSANVGATYGMNRDLDISHLAQDADLYIADSQYTPEEYVNKHGWGHSSYYDAVHLALEARAKRLALFSHDPMHDDSAVDQKVAGARRLAGISGSNMDIFAAAEGQEIDLDVAEANLGAGSGRQESGAGERSWPTASQTGNKDFTFYI